MDTRPTTDRVREAWMSAVATGVRGARVLDLFAGSGALGLEALSRGAEHVVFVENSAIALRALRENLEALGGTRRATVVRADAMGYATALGSEEFDLAFADPPYVAGYATALAVAFAKCSFARLLAVEHHKDDPLPALPASARSRRYGDTVLTFISAP
ncbi:MAG: RsmD family RNA methyltransferase [Gemmatimonadota bacterium]|nr:RsmD family RNA methyltransferase [Gemmatimonadota bacterium]